MVKPTQKTGKRVNDGKITIDDNIMKWVEDSKALYDAKETSSAELWSDDWKKGFYPERYERLLRRKCKRIIRLLK